MVAEITAPKSLYDVLEYNFSKVLDKKGAIILTSRIPTEDLKALETIQQAMAAYVPSNTRTKKVVFHCSLNPHPEDKLSTEQLQDIARQYMKEMGYGNQPYIVFKHNDIEREHIHIVSLRVDHTGKKLPYAFEARRSKKITNAIEERYKLIPSGNRRQRQEQQASKLQLLPIDRTKGNIHQQMNSIIRSVKKHYAFQSIGEFNALLNHYGINAETVKTEHQGRQTEGLVYTLMDTEQGTPPISASTLHKDCSLNALQQHFLKSKHIVRRKAKQVRAIINKALKDNPSQEAFLSELRHQGLDVLLRTNTQGRLYGITFISEDLGIICNGSRLGKAYSANKFNVYFNGVPFTPPKEIEQSDQKQVSQEQSLQQEASESLSPIALDDYIPVIDYDELAFQRKLRRQNKMKISRRR